jgi:hypothetical protein
VVAAAAAVLVELLRDLVVVLAGVEAALDLAAVLVDLQHLVKGTRVELGKQELHLGVAVAAVRALLAQQARHLATAEQVRLPL